MTRLIDRFAVVLVALAAMLWATDEYFRPTMLQHLSADPLLGPVQVVFMEHITLTILVLPILWWARHEIAKLSWRQWAAVIAIGVGASALATVFFTRSFGYGHYITTLLLQKTQPLIAILLARIWLKEQLPPRSYVWMPIAFVGAYLIAVPDPLHPENAVADFHAAAALFALAAAVLWGAATVFGRWALSSIRFPTLTALRFATGMPALAIALVVIAGPSAFALYTPTDVPLYLGIAIVPGLIPMLIYYRGLASTPASMATLAELAFPVTAVLAGVLFLAQTVTAVQIAGTVVLWAAIAALDLENARRPAKVEPALEGSGPARIAAT